MIYCVVTPELEEEMYAQLVEYYKGNANVEVIIDRREGPDRRDRLPNPPPEVVEKRQTRDRRRPRVTGEFRQTDLPE